MHLADAFVQSDLQWIQVIHFIVSMCVPWESNPQPFALLTQCSSTEQQEPLMVQSFLPWWLSVHNICVGLSLSFYTFIATNINTCAMHCAFWK